MLIRTPPDAFQKVVLLETAAQYDVCAAPRATDTRRPQGTRSLPAGVTRVHLPTGGCVNHLKVLMTNECVNDCGYCVNQTGRDTPRLGFRPEELAAHFWRLYEAKYVTGLFLSSAIAAHPCATMEHMLKAVEILRQRYRFTGYVHLKVMPGATYDYVEQACRLATRVSINVEAPTPEHLGKLSSRKDLGHDILERMRWIRQITQANEVAPAGQTTQYVVGAAGETDHDIYQSTQRLYREMGLRRAYFSAFEPIRGGRLEDKPPTPPMREARLYELDWLQRVYRFDQAELETAFDEKGILSLERDPKMTIALRRLDTFPVDPNRADPWELLRVPGFGPISVERILSRRRECSIRSLDDLRQLGVPAKRAAPFVYLPEHRPMPVQLALL